MNLPYRVICSEYFLCRLVNFADTCRDNHCPQVLYPRKELMVYVERFGLDRWHFVYKAGPQQWCFTKAMRELLDVSIMHC